MTNGEEEQAILNSLKQIVKHTSRRKASSQSSSERTIPTRIAPKERDVPDLVSSVPVSSTQNLSRRSTKHSADVSANMLEVVLVVGKLMPWKC